MTSIAYFSVNSWLFCSGTFLHLETGTRVPQVFISRKVSSKGLLQVQRPCASQVALKLDPSTNHRSMVSWDFTKTEMHPYNVTAFFSWKSVPLGNFPRPLFTDECTLLIY